jgi:hypothetical protein
MRIRALIWLTAIVASILGGVAVYLALSVPNDLKADAMLKSSRDHLARGDTNAARESLQAIVQQYPRTDAAAAATVALSRIGDRDRAKLDVELKRLREENVQQTKILDELRESIDGVKRTPPTVVAAVPASAPTAAEKPPAEKPVTKRAAPKSPTKKKTSPNRRRRR